jgi:hypothetical protein
MLLSVVPQETIMPTVFTTRHTATCRLSYVDPEVVQYLGYLPQDMIDRSLFDFYYPEDLALIKEIYKIVSMRPYLVECDSVATMLFVYLFILGSLTLSLTGSNQCFLIFDKK